MIRPVRPQEFAAVGEISVAAYVSQGTAEPGDDYLGFLADTAGRVADPLSEVLVALEGDELVGTVTICPFGSPLTEVCLPGELEFRVLAVAPGHQRTGVAEDLIAACLTWAREHWMHTMTICVTETNTAGHALYRKLGFTRQPDRDWVAGGHVPLQTYTFTLADAPLPEHADSEVYCPRCGKELTDGDHTACAAALDLEPPRYCTYCKRRMVVQVVPTGWRAKCVQHGVVTVG